jgi:hypothetical protein
MDELKMSDRSDFYRSSLVGYLSDRNRAAIARIRGLKPLPWRIFALLAFSLLYVFVFADLVGDSSTACPERAADDGAFASAGEASDDCSSGG